MDLNEKGFLGSAIESFSTSLLNEHRQFFDACFQLNEFAQKTKFDLSNSREDSQKFLAAILYIRLLNSFQATIILALKGMPTEARVILRSSLEVLFLLTTTCKEEAFTEEYFKSNQASRFKLLKLAHGPQKDNPIFALTRDFATPEIMEELEQTVQQDDCKEFKVRDIAERAELLDIYHTAYKLLSEDAHCLPFSLKSFLPTEGQEARDDLEWGPTDRDVPMILQTSLETLLMGLEVTKELFQINCAVDIQNHTQTISALRKMVLKPTE